MQKSGTCSAVAVSNDDQTADGPLPAVLCSHVKNTLHLQSNKLINKFCWVQTICLNDFPFWKFLWTKYDFWVPLTVVILNTCQQPVKLMNYIQ